jgi:hypothetical protein
MSGWDCSVHEREERSVYRISVQNLKGKRPLWRPSRRWEDNIKMDVIKIGSEGVDWFQLTQDTDKCRVVLNIVTKFRVMYNVVDFLKS